MQVYNGKSVFGGIAIGKISVYQKKEQQVKRVKVEDPDQEMARYGKAKAEGIRQLQGLYDKALKEVGEANAAIFEVHQMMMEDDGYNESVENIVRSQWQPQETITHRCFLPWMTTTCGSVLQMSGIFQSVFSPS